MAQDLVILSPEKVPLQFRLASVGGRVTALCLDLFILICLLVAVSVAMGLMAAFGSLPEGFVNGFMAVSFSLGPFLYFILFEGFWNGQTLGKKALGLRVRMADGTAITPLAAFGRNLIRPADLMPGTGFAGLITMFMTPRCQRLGDLVSNTVVLYDKRPEPVFDLSPNERGYHPLENRVGDLSRMTIDEYHALRRLCDRFPQLTRDVQVRLMREVWAPFAARHQIDAPQNIDPIYFAEAVVMRYGRIHGML